MSDGVTASKKIKPPPVSARSVVVMCKIPNGLQLQLQRKVPRAVETRDGLKELMFWEKCGRVYHVNGPAYPVGTVPKGYPKQPLVEGGYAATKSIPADFWAEWLEQNKLAPYVVPPDGADRGMIWAEPDLESAISAAEEHETLMSGLEPLSTDVDKNGRFTDKRAPRPIGGGLTKVGPEQRLGAGTALESAA